MRSGVSDPNDIAAYGLMLNRVSVGVRSLSSRMTVVALLKTGPEGLRLIFERAEVMGEIP